MSSLPKPTLASSSSTSNPNLDELRWVIQIRRTLEEDQELDDDDDDNNINPVCISNVPKTLMSCKPEAYIPQQVALGPYHYCRPELYEMGRYKLDAARRRQKQLLMMNNGLKFQDLVESYLMKLDARIRSCYHKYLDFNSETLAWIMGVDASFLLEFLQIYAIKEGYKDALPRVSSRMLHLVDYSGRKSAHNVILRDIMMLENQIPLFILRKILEIQYSSLETADDILCSMLNGLIKEISAFKITNMEYDQYYYLSSSSNNSHPPLAAAAVTGGHAHLLDFLYHMLVPPQSPVPEEKTEINEDDDNDQSNEAASMRDDEESSLGTTTASQLVVKQLFHEVWGLLKKLNRGSIIPIRLLIKNAIVSRPVKLIAKLIPCMIITRLPGFACILKLPIKHFSLFCQDKDQEIIMMKPAENEGTAINKPPLMEEITIPSVTELFKSGVRFAPTNGNIETIKFDEKTVTLYLPTISLDINTEVILRNLVAYEASTASSGHELVFARYTELMNGIIDTADDAKLLREKGIVLNRLKSDEEVANLWNGMSNSVRLTKVPFLDKVIEDVNKYYGGRWKVRVKKFMKTYVFGSWQFLTFLAAILLLLLVALQAFCSVFSCARFLKLKTAHS